MPASPLPARGQGARPSTEHPEWLLRAALLRVASPGDPTVHTELRRAGPAAALAQCLGALSRSDSQRVLAAARTDLEAARARGARLLIPGDPEWPAGLDDLPIGPGPGPPFALYARGRELDSPARAVSVTGSRAATRYGCSIAADWSEVLARAGHPVVSGGALGIDGASHRGALAGGGLTVAVLASGVDVADPPAHRGLLSRIAAQGTVLSEAPPGAVTVGTLRRARHRLLAALGAVVLVVEAGEADAALASARWGRVLLRQVLAVPGPVTAAASRGTNALLVAGPHAGALAAASSGDVLAAAAPLGHAALEDAGHARALAGPLGAGGAGAQRWRADTIALLGAFPAARAVPVAEVARRAGVTPELARAVLPALADAGLVTRVGTGWRLTALGCAG